MPFCLMLDHPIEGFVSIDLRVSISVKIEEEREVNHLLILEIATRLTAKPSQKVWNTRILKFHRIRFRFALP